MTVLYMLSDIVGEPKREDSPVKDYLCKVKAISDIVQCSSAIYE